MKQSLIALLVFLPFQVEASGLQASFGSPNLTGLTRVSTQFESDGRVDATNNLLDISGNARNLAPTAAPTTAISSFQRSDGNKWQGKTFNGTTQYYSLAHAAWMDMFDTDFTLTMIASTTVNGSVLFAHGLENTSGLYAQMSSLLQVRPSQLGARLTIDSGANTTTYAGNYYVLQVVRRSNIMTVYSNGISGASVDVTGYGIDGNAVFYIGCYAASSFHTGAILYTRIDAEALTEERLAYEKDYLLGLATRSGTANISWDFSRASAATFEYSDKSVSYSAATNIPRVSGDGGGALVEGQRTNLVLQSQTLAATWTSVNLTTISANGTAALDGTATADGLVADVTNGVHGITQAVTLTATNYTISTYAKIGDKNWVYLSDDTVANAVSYFDINSCTVGTKGIGAIVATAAQAVNGWCRCSIVVLGTAAAHTIRIASALANDDNTFAGDTATVNTWFWGAQVELGSFPSTYIPTVASTVIRYQDNLTIMPIKLGKDLRIPGSTPKLEVDFSQNPLSATVLDNTSTYTFTKGGTVTALDDYTRGRRFVFNGTDSQYVLADAGAIFSPAGNFSVVVVATPAVIPGTFSYLFGKYTTTGDKRSWSIYNNSTGEWTFAVSRGGDSGTTSFVQKTDGVQLGRTALIVATYNCPTPPCAIASGGPGNNYEAKIYVDDTTVVTDSAFYGPPYVSDSDMTIGRSGSGSRFTGQLHYVALYDGTVIAPEQVTALYTKFKQSNVLPTGLGTGYVGQKLTIEFEAKCQFTSLTDMGADHTFLAIGSTYFTGTPGGATLTRNYINIFAESADGKVYADFYSATSTTRRFMYTAVISTFNQWHKYKVYYDFSNLASSNIWVDGVAGTLDASMTAAAHTFGTTDLYIRVGQPNNAVVTTNTMLGTTDGHCSMRNMRVQPNQF